MEPDHKAGRLILFTGLIACVFSYNSIIRAYKLVAASVNDFQWVLRELFKYIYVQIHICVYLAQRAPPSVVPPPDPPPIGTQRGGRGEGDFLFFLSAVRFMCVLVTHNAYSLQFRELRNATNRDGDSLIPKRETSQFSTPIERIHGDGPLCRYQAREYGI